MGAPTEYYVDPTVASDGGSGTSGSPWTRADGQVLQYAADNITRDSTNGDRINIKSGTPHSDVTASLSLATYGTPTNSAPLWLQGYTSVAGDGGKAEVNQSANRTLFSTGYNYIRLCDINFDSTRVVIGVYSTISRCNVTDVDASTGINAGAQSHVLSCYVQGITSGGTGIQVGNYSIISGCYVDMSTGSPSGYALRLLGVGIIAEFNIIEVSNSANGILMDSHACRAINNSIYCHGAGTGIGIYANGADYITIAYNNLIEGFSGTGGTALQNVTNANQSSMFGNAIYDCDTDSSFSADEWFIVSDLENESLGSSPFADAAGGDFTPQDVGNVLTGYFDSVNGHSVVNFKGAVSPTAGGGGSTAVNPLSGGLIK